MELSHLLINELVAPITMVMFFVALFCLMADVRPEPVVHGMLNVIWSIIAGLFNILAMLLTALLGVDSTTKKKPGPHPKLPFWQRPKR